MSWRDDWYASQLRAQREIRGDGIRGTGSTGGATLPAMFAIDTIAVLGQMSGAIVQAIESYQETQGAPPSAMWIGTQGLDHRTGIFDGGSMGAIIGSRTISIPDYVAGYAPSKTQGHLRSPTSPLGLRPDGATDLHTVWVPDGPSVEDGILSFIRGMLTNWQRVVDISAAIIRANALNLMTTIEPNSADVFWGCVARLAIDLDVLGENPPESTYDKVRKAARDALDKSADAAGRGAAILAENVGRTAGNVGKGFFEEAGVTSLIVAGVAVAIMLH